MIRSMTGFARREAEIGNGRLQWELRAVNHRYLETSLRLPEELRSLEPAAREALRERLGRGKVEGYLRWQPSHETSGRLALDAGLLGEIQTALAAVTKAIPNTAPANPMEILRWPGVVSAPAVDTTRLREPVLNLLEQALDELVQQRLQEGERLAQTLTSRGAELADWVAAIRARRPAVQAALRDKLLNRVAEVSANPNEDRLEQELALLAQKMDVAEELDRLDSHITALRTALTQTEPVGRRLDFLMQELNREANTLSAKAADAETTAATVEMKVLIEQMREQVQNIE